MTNQNPDINQALRRFQNPAAQSRISTIKSGSASQHDRWNATIEYGRKSHFQNILDFFVNLPSLQSTFPDPEKTAEWLWKPVQPNPIDLQFFYRPELLQLLRQQGLTDTHVQNGWLLHEETTQTQKSTNPEANSTTQTHLLQTNHHYLHLHLHSELTP